MISTESWGYILARQAFRQYASRLVTSVWGDSLRDLYVVYGRGHPYPLFVCWEGIWFVRKESTNYTKPPADLPLSPMVLTEPNQLAVLIMLNRPTGDLLCAALDTGVLPDRVVAQLVADRIGVWS